MFKVELLLRVSTCASSFDILVQIRKGMSFPHKEPQVSQCLAYRMEAEFQFLLCLCPSGSLPLCKMQLAQEYAPALVRTRSGRISTEKMVYFWEMGSGLVVSETLNA